MSQTTDQLENRLDKLEKLILDVRFAASEYLVFENDDAKKRLIKALDLESIYYDHWREE